MKIRLGAVLLMLAVFGGAAAADHIPVAPPLPLEYEPVGRVIASVGAFNPYLEVLGRWNDPSPGFGYRSVTVGSYFRVIRNLKVGAFYRLQADARHNDDWVASGLVSPGWIWQDTSNRYENLLVLDASPRFLLPIPGKSTVFMLKSRWTYNFFNGQQSLLLRPGLTYFFIRDRQPIAEIRLQYAAYLALNFGEALLYRQAPYLEGLYHLTPDLLVSFSASYQNRVWTTSSGVVAAGDSHYSVNFPSLRFQAGIIYRPGF